jgi:ABC-type uncharacterized transport system ATPase subunit
VTHALDTVHELCDRAIWIDEGQIRFSGETQQVVDMYRDSLEFESSLTTSQKRRIVTAGQQPPESRQTPMPLDDE